MGPFGVPSCFRFAGMPFEVATRSAGLFAKEVMPVLRSCGSTPPVQQAERA